MKKNLGVAIRETRELRGMTQGELGQLAELSSSQISNIERGAFAPSFDALAGGQRVSGSRTEKSC
jgi:transcriptional regulator with XRE-family HTH domain